MTVLVALRGTLDSGRPEFWRCTGQYTIVGARLEIHAGRIGAGPRGSHAVRHRAGVGAELAGRRFGRVADFVMRRWQLQPVPYPQAPLHVHHRGDEGFVVLAGRLEVTRGDEVVLLSAGEFAIVSAGTPHTFATVDDEPATVLVTMTPEIDELVHALHEVPPEERDAVWERYNSSRM